MKKKKNSISGFRLDSELKAQAQAQAIKESRTLSSLVTFILKKYLEEQKEAA